LTIDEFTLYLTKKEGDTMNKQRFITLSSFGLFFAATFLVNHSTAFAQTLSNEPLVAKNVQGLDTASLQDAVNKSTHVLLNSGQTYIIDQPIEVDHALTIETTGKEKAIILNKNKDAHDHAFHFKNEAISTTTVVQNIQKDSPYIVLKNASSIQPGQLLYVKSSKLWYWDAREGKENLSKGELHQVQKVEGNKVYLNETTRDNYTLSQETLTVTNYENRSLTMKNLVFRHPDYNEGEKPYNTIMVKVDLSTNALFDGVDVYGSRRAGILLDRTYKTTVTHSTIDLNITNKEIPSGYGVQDYGGMYNVIRDSYFIHVRRGIDFSGITPSRFGRATGNTVIGPDKNILSSGNSGIGTHSTAEDIIIDNNTVQGFSYSFLSRGNRITIRNNESTGTIRAFISATYGDNILAYNNKYTNAQGGNAENFLRVVKTFDGRITLRHNYAGVIIKDFVQNDAPKTKGISLLNNRGVFIQKSATSSLLIRSIVPVKLTHSTITENTMTMRQGKKAFTKNVDLSSTTNVVDKAY